MKTRSPIPMRFHARWLLLLVLLAVPLSSFAQWQAKAGAQSPDCLVGGDADLKLAQGCEARQAMAFIPNEIWIHQNDSITWTFGHGRRSYRDLP